MSSPREISSLQEIFRRIPRAEGLEMIYYTEKFRQMFVQTRKVFLCCCNVNNATEDIICKFCYSFSVSGISIVINCLISSNSSSISCCSTSAILNLHNIQKWNPPPGDSKSNLPGDLGEYHASGKKPRVRISYRMAFAEKYYGHVLLKEHFDWVS